MEMDAIDIFAAQAFDGFMVRKDLVRRFKNQYPVPTYVVEFLLGRYCASVDEQEIQDGLQVVQRQLVDRAVRAGTEELFKSRAREKGSVKIIDLVTARLDAKSDAYLAELPSLPFTPRSNCRTMPRLRRKIVADHLGLPHCGKFNSLSVMYSIR